MADLLRRPQHALVAAPLEVGQRAEAHARRFRELCRQPTRKLAHRAELCGVLGIARQGRIVDEQDDSPVGRLLQGGREQRLAHHARLLLIGGDQDGDPRRQLLVVDPLQLFGGRGLV
jgi:hypothetical protein